MVLGRLTAAEYHRLTVFGLSVPACYFLAALRDADLLAWPWYSIISISPLVVWVVTMGTAGILKRTWRLKS